MVPVGTRSKKFVFNYLNLSVVNYKQAHDDIVVIETIDFYILSFHF